MHGKLAQGLMTGRKVLSPPSWRSLRNPITGVPRRAETEAFFQYGPPQSFFELSWLALQKARARSWRNDDDRAQISNPRLLALVPQSDHGSAARAETEAFFQDGPPQSFFQLSWLALQKARREVGATMMTGRKFLSPPSYGSLRNPITGVPRARKLKLFSNMARRNPFSRYWLALQKARREVGARTDDRAQISKRPPLLWLAPQSDHGSAACAETDAFFQHGPLQPFFEFNSAGRPAKSTRAA